MKTIATRPLLFGTLSLWVTVAAFSPGPLWGQLPVPIATPTTPNAQRNALSLVQTQVGWLQNATRTAPSSTTGL